MKAVVDRIVQYPNRYKLTNAETSEVLGTFDFDEVTGTVQQVGTEINAELFDSIAADLTELITKIKDGSIVAEKATNDADGNNIPATYAKQNGTYVSLISGGIQCIPLNENADLNECVPENTSVFQVWVCTGGSLSNSYANTPYQNFNRTFYLTAVKTWYDSSDTSRYRVNQTLYSITSGGDSLIWTRCIDGAGSAGWSAWKELVTSDGEYETLGAGYLSRYGYVNASAMGWYKIATVDISQAGFKYNSYSCIMLINGIHAPQQFVNPNKSGCIELDIRYDAGVVLASQSGISVSWGNLDPNDFCITISGTVITLYAHMPYQSAQSVFVILQEACENTPITQILNFTISNVGTSAPSGAVDAKIRNKASDSDALGGKPASEYALKTELNSLVKKVSRTTPAIKAWKTKTWKGLTSIAGSNIWTDGTNIYYSAGALQYVLDVETSTWNKKTWNGVEPPFGGAIWTDGTNIYYSAGALQYVLDVETSTWKTKAWNGLTAFDSRYIWTDGTNIYSSSGSINSQYVLDVETSTWKTKAWNGLTAFDSRYIWTDGTNIYSSSGSINSQYVLDVETSTWKTKAWNGLMVIDASYIWTDGTNIYYSAGALQYVLDVETSTWKTKTWNGVEPPSGGAIWTDGVNIYYSSGSNQYILASATTKTI